MHLFFSLRKERLVDAVWKERWTRTRWNNGWLLITGGWKSTIVVAVGILGECVAHFIFEKDARKNKAAMSVSILLGLFVVGGVVGEFICDLIRSRGENVRFQFLRSSRG